MEKVIKSLLFFFIPCHSFIYDLRVVDLASVQKVSPAYFIGLSDFHDKDHAATPMQLSCLKRLISLCDPAKTRFILEDLSSKGSNNRNSCNSFRINSRGGILGGLAQYIRNQQFLVDNIEYRYCRVSSLGPILNNSNADLASINSANMICLNHLIQEIEEIMHEVRGYRDGQFTQFYSKTLNDITQELEKLGWHNTKSTVAEYIHNNSTKNSRVELVKRLLIFDSTLLDLKLVHHVINAQQPIVIAIAGGSHIARVADILEKNGYPSLYKSSITMLKESNLQQCLGSAIIADSYCMRPGPIDITTIEKYLPQVSR